MIKVSKVVKNRIYGDNNICIGYQSGFVNGLTTTTTNNTFIGTFKSEALANEYCRKNGGYIEEVYNNYHPEYPFMDK